MNTKSKKVRAKKGKSKKKSKKINKTITEISTESDIIEYEGNIPQTLLDDNMFIPENKKGYQFSDKHKKSLTPSSSSSDSNNSLRSKSRSGILPYYFFDNKKGQQKVWPIMMNVTLPNKTIATTRGSSTHEWRCWWDRYPFNTRPLGCPLKCVKIEDEDAYETEGIFCSFCCCKAYILDQKNNLKYKESLALLSAMYLSFYNKKAVFPTAPSFKMLVEYGGPLSIEEFRDSFGITDYDETVNMKRSLLVSRSPYILEKNR